MSRVFFALWPDDEVRDGLGRWIQEARVIAGGRATQARNLHLTLAFIGETDARRFPELVAAAAGIRLPPCELIIDQCRYWKHNRIVWAGGGAPQALNEGVAQLRAALQAAGIRFDGKAFVPHVTLLRDARAVPQLPQLAPVRWHIRDFVLLASGRDGDGPIYRVVAGPFVKA